MRSVDRRTLLKGISAGGVVGFAGCITGDGGGTGGGGTGGGGGNDTGANGGNGSGGGAGGGGTRLTWDAGGTGGTYYPLSNQFKQVVESNTDYGLQVRSTGASVENVGNLAGGDADFALIQNDIAYFAKNGTGIEDFEGNAVPGLRGVATLYPETISVVTLADDNINSIRDLEGKTINTGDLGSGTQVNALQILEAVGITPDDFTEQNTGFSQATDQLQNGDIAAAFVVGGWPVGAIESLATTTAIDILEIAGDVREQIKESARWFSNDTIPGGTYSGIEEPTETVAVQAMIATTEAQSTEVVNTITAAIFDNIDGITIKEDFISKESAQDGMSIELHPGAAAYFGEGGGGN